MEPRTDHATNPAQQPPVRRKNRRWPLLLLVIPIIGPLWVSSYMSLTPTLWGIPFFYWYQLLWVVIGAALTILAYIGDPS